MTLHAAAPLNTMRDLQYAYTAAADINSAFSAHAVGKMQSIDWRVRWCDLATTERILLRCAYEAHFRQPCPLPLHPEA